MRLLVFSILIGGLRQFALEAIEVEGVEFYSIEERLMIVILVVEVASYAVPYCCWVLQYLIC